MDFRPLNTLERRQLVDALRGNAESDRAILIEHVDLRASTRRCCDRLAGVAHDKVPAYGLLQHRV